MTRLPERTRHTFIKTMPIKALLLWCLLQAGAAHSTDATVERTFDGRFGSRCLVWERDATKELCQVSFIRLIAAPERYDGKMIAVSGYLVKAFGRYVLFASKERFEANAQIEGIEVDASVLSKDIEDKVDEGTYPVLVIGTFDAKYVGADVPRLGMVRSVISVRPLKGAPKG